MNYDRENGYYWVLFMGEWTIAYKDDDIWFIVGSDEIFDDEDFGEIGSLIIRC